MALSDGGLEFRSKRRDLYKKVKKMILGSKVPSSAHLGNLAKRSRRQEYLGGLLLIFLLFTFTSYSQISLPIAVTDRHDISYIKLTEIGQFGLLRKARKAVPAHYHTGIDIKRPGNNYINEPIFPIAEGIIISKRIDGPYAQLIIEHKFKGRQFWSVYEHIAEIRVSVNNFVEPNTPIARFMNKDELNKFGWQFDHLHLEILKMKPMALKPDKNHPQRYYNSYSLICYEPADLQRYFYNPLEFLKRFNTEK
jgi:hypothetical protein